MITPDFSAYAVKVDVHFHGGVGPREIQARVEGLMSKIAIECVKAGAVLIGHIKCVVETPGKGFLAVSVTDADGKPYSRGGLEEGIKEMDVIVNVLLYGLPRQRIQELVDALAKKELSFPGAEIDVEDLEKAHDHEHEHGHDHDHDHEHEHEEC